MRWGATTTNGPAADGDVTLPTVPSIDVNTGVRALPNRYRQTLVNPFESDTRCQWLQLISSQSQFVISKNIKFSRIFYYSAVCKNNVPLKPIIC